MDKITDLQQQLAQVEEEIKRLNRSHFISTGVGLGDCIATDDVLFLVNKIIQQAISALEQKDKEIEEKVKKLKERKTTFDFLDEKEYYLLCKVIDKLFGEGK